MNQVTECVNCGWKQAGTIMTHDEYVEANRMMAWLCAKPSMGPLEAVMPPRPANADPVLDEDGNVIGYAISAFTEGDTVTSSLFDGIGTVLEVAEDEELPRVRVRLPEDSGVATVAGVAAYAPEDLRRA